MKIRKDRIQFFEKCIADFFQKAGREHLPWRGKRVSAYEVWVSEVMLQQTQASRVIGYYKKFLKCFPAVEVLAKASWKEFLPYYEGLGYYNRGRNMLKTANIIVTQYSGTFPRDRKTLETLPGIGPYTAAAIMSFAYGDEYLAWDTNLKRVIGRFFFGSKYMAMDTAWWERTLATPKKTLNAAMMDFGSALCVARPKCSACSLKTQCKYFKTKGRYEKSTINKKQSTENKKQEKYNTKGDWTDAEVRVFLHENHRVYFSANKKTFQPFILPAAYNTRSGIKEYFEERYALRLSVRPPHGKLLVRRKPVLLVNAQVLLGTPRFRIFPKNTVTRYTKDTFK